MFFPLHAEPESSLQVASPECLVQLSTITSLARDLPAGYYLAVKETYQTYGRRPSNFYDQIREFKNVVLLDMLELGLEVARRAEAVATITGVLWGMALFGETHSAWVWGALVILIAGMALVQERKIERS